MLSQISGVLTIPVMSIPDGRGCVWKMKNPPFDVKDVYVTTVHQNVIKAWHGYNTKKIYYTVVKGMVQLALFDSRESSSTNGVYDTLFLGDDSRFSVLIPPGVFAGFKGISHEDAIVVVQTSEEYRQINRLPFDYLDYDWSTKNG